MWLFRFDRFPAGSDPVISIVLHALAATATQKPLPPVLYLHLDNCSRENKNKYVMGLCHLLVKWGVFKKVKLCFLPVGPTHEDVDQMFAKLSDALRVSDIITLSDLHRICEKAYTPRPICTFLEDIGLWSRWMRPFLPPIHGITKPRCFKILRKGHRVCHWYRQNLQTSKRTDPDCWFPSNSVYKKIYCVHVFCKTQHKFIL